MKPHIFSCSHIVEVFLSDIQILLKEQKKILLKFFLFLKVVSLSIRLAHGDKKSTL